MLIFPNFQGCSSIIVPAMSFWILKFKWAWQTQFLSHNLVTLKNYVFFKDLQMILVPFFHIPTGFQLRKNGFKSSVHILRCPWSGVHEKKKPFICDQCPSRFSLKHTLKKHIASVHEGKKPYKCDTCLSHFSQKGHLNTHIKTVHKRCKPYK